MHCLLSVALLSRFKVILVSDAPWEKDQVFYVRIFVFMFPITATWLAQLEEHRSAEREVAGSNHGRPNTQGL